MDFQAGQTWTGEIHDIPGLSLRLRALFPHPTHSQQNAHRNFLLERVLRLGF